MSESVEPGQDPGAPDAVELRETVDGVVVRKVARLHDRGAAAIYFTFKSARPDRCRVRVRDPLPTPLQHSTIEFHPHYDPDHWYQTDGATVYQAPLVAEGERMTAYGVVIDDPGQLDLFDVAPEVMVEPAGDGEVLPADVPTPSADDGFAFGAGSSEGSTAETASAPDGGSTTAAGSETERTTDDTVGTLSETDGPASSRGEDAQPADAGVGADEASSQPPRGPGAGTIRGDGDVADELVAALERREQTAEWRQDLRAALGLERDGARDSQVAALAEQVDALRARVAELEATLEREAEWRDRLRRQLAADPEDS